jgi:uncharacterized protein (TIGR02284 family)
MATNDLNMLMHDLVELDFDAIEAYQAAIERVPEPADKTKLTEFLDDHRRHTMALGRLLEERHERVPTSGDFRRVLTQGRVVIAALVSHQEILEALRHDEDTTNQVYERALSQRDVPEEVRLVFERGYRDERRHRAWIVQRIATMR